MGMTRVIPAAVAACLLMGCVSYAGGSYAGVHSPGNHGSGHGAGQPPGHAGRDRVIRCESDSYRTRHCDMDTRGGVTLARQLSRADCVHGSNWGWDRRGVWVSQGCRAEFVSGGGGRPGHGASTRPGDAGMARTLRCESESNRYRHCPSAVHRDVQLVRQLSKTRCVLGQNWNWDRRGVWVDRGCRAEFSIR